MRKTYAYIKVVLVSIIILMLVVFSLKNKGPYKELWIISGALLVFIILFFEYFRSSVRNKRILKDGVTAEGKIIEVWRTGTRVNKRPQVGLLLEVKALARPPFTAEAYTISSSRSIDQFQIGTILQIKYDPNDLKYAAVVSNKPIIHA